MSPTPTGGASGHRAVDAAGPPGDHRRGRILSARRGLISAGAGLAAGAVVGVLGAPELVPLVTWTAASTVLLGVWRISWPLDPQGTKRLAEEESHSRSSDAAAGRVTLLTVLG